MPWAKRGFKKAAGGNVRKRQEARMIKLATLATFVMAMVAAASVIPALAAGGGGDPVSMDPNPVTKPSPATKAPATHTTVTHTTARGKKKPDKQSSLGDPAFAQGYRAAYATVYDRNDYA